MTNGLLQASGAPVVDTWTLPVTGTYTIYLDPSYATVGSITLTFYNVPADAARTVTINGAAVDVTTHTPGQNATVSFNGASGQQATVRITNNTLGIINYTLYRPGNVYLINQSSNSASFDMVTQTLPDTGTYTLKIDPYLTPATGSVTISVTSP